MDNLKNIFLLATAFLALFAISEFIYRTFKIKAEYTRKLVHVGTGILSMLFPVFLNSHWEVLFLCTSFAVILMASFKLKFLQSVNAIGRKSFGSLSYPIAVYFAFLTYTYVDARGISFLHPLLFFYLPILIMALCDPVAALVGRKYPVKTFKIGNGRKSIGGSFSFLLVAILLAAFLMSIFQKDFSDNLLFYTALLTAGTTMIVEAISPHGLDNITIPATAIGSLLLINFYLFIH